MRCRSASETAASIVRSLDREPRYGRFTKCTFLERHCAMTRSNAGARCEADPTESTTTRTLSMIGNAKICRTWLAISDETVARIGYFAVTLLGIGCGLTLANINGETAKS